MLITSYCHLQFGTLWDRVESGSHKRWTISRPPPLNRWSGSTPHQCTGIGRSAKYPQVSHPHQEHGRPEREWRVALTKDIHKGRMIEANYKWGPRDQRFRIRKLFTSKTNSLSQSWSSLCRIQGRHCLVWFPPPPSPHSPGVVGSWSFVSPTDKYPWVHDPCQQWYDHGPGIQCTGSRSQSCIGIGTFIRVINNIIVCTHEALPDH